jgi:hypothetical protein
VFGTPRNTRRNRTSPRQQDKAFRGIRSLDDLARPLAKFVQFARQIVTGMCGIGEDLTKPGRRAGQRLQQERRTIAILHIGRGTMAPTSNPMVSVSIRRLRSFTFVPAS